MTSTGPGRRRPSKTARYCSWDMPTETPLFPEPVFHRMNARGTVRIKTSHASIATRPDEIVSFIQEAFEKA
jgi:hypothetical protein